MAKLDNAAERPDEAMRPRASERRSKRSGRVRLAAMGVAGAAAIAGCDNATRSPEAPVFTSIEQCAESGEYTREECEIGLRFALQQQYAAGETHYRTQGQCNQVFGAGHCYSYPSPGGDIWMGLLGGYLIGEMINGRRDYYSYNYGGHWSRYDSGAGRISRSYRTPANLPRPARATIPKPTRAHTAAITRGGFGSSSRSGSSWGG